MKKFTSYVLLVAHALFLLILSFVLLSLPYTYENEASIISWVSVTKNTLFGLETKPDPKEFLLVNVAYQKKLLPRVDEFGFEIGNEALTDRQRLAELFQKTATYNNHKFIFCDVFLDTPTPDDSILETSVHDTRRILFPYHRVDGEFVKPVVDVPYAFSDYESDFGTFLKYSYIQYDTCRTVARKIHESLSKESFDKGLLFHRRNGHPILNSFILEFPVRQYDIFRNDTLGYSSIHLQNLLELPDDMIRETLADKLIIIGDFLESDLHTTIYGTTAGPLIHLNAYLNLRDHRNDVSLLFIVYLFLVNLAISFWLFFPGKIGSFQWFARIQNSKIGGFIVDYVKYASFLLLASVLSYIIFGIHLNILIISLYITIVENGMQYLAERKLKRELKQVEHV